MAFLVFFSFFHSIYFGDDFDFLQQSRSGLFWSSQNAIQSLVTIGPPEKLFSGGPIVARFYILIGMDYGGQFCEI